MPPRSHPKLDAPCWCGVVCARMADGLLEAVRRLWLAVRGLVVLGLKPLLAKLREQQPDLALKVESEARKATAAAPAVADSGGAPSGVALSLACFGCARLPSDI